jgi:hypothetical protein
VEEHFGEGGLTDSEMSQLSTTTTALFEQTGRERTHQIKKLYGTTLLGFVADTDGAAAWQIGDGLMAIVDVNLDISFPLIDNEAPLGDNVESMATAEAERLFQTRAWRENATQIRLAALLTDGVEKAYASLTDLESILQQIAEKCQKHPSEVQEILVSTSEELAKKASSVSGDDATVVLLWQQEGEI